MNSSNYSCLVKLASQAPHMDNTGASHPPIPPPAEMEMMRMRASLKLNPTLLKDNRLPRTVGPYPQPREQGGKLGLTTPKTMGYVHPGSIVDRKSIPDRLRNLRQYNPARILVQAMSGAPHMDNTGASHPPIPPPEEAMWMRALLKLDPPATLIDYRLPRTSAPYPQPREQGGKLGLTTPKTMGYVHPGSIVDWKSIPDRLRNLRQYISGYPGSM